MRVLKWYYHISDTGQLDELLQLRLEEVHRSETAIAYLTNLFLLNAHPLRIPGYL